MQEAAWGTRHRVAERFLVPDPVGRASDLDDGHDNSGNRHRQCEAPFEVGEAPCGDDLLRPSGPVRHFVRKT